MAPTAFWIKSKSLNEAYKILKELVALQFHTLSFSVLYSISSHNKLLSVQKVQWEITTSTFLCLFAQDVLSARNNPPPLQTSTPRLSLNIHFLWGKRLCSLLTRTTLSACYPAISPPRRDCSNQEAINIACCCPPSAEQCPPHSRCSTGTS